MKTSQRAKARLKELEGFRGRAYRCSAGVWTLGYGFTDGVHEGDTITRAGADLRLEDELEEYEQAVWAATGGNVNQNEFDAMVILTFNIGIAGFKRSTVLKAHNRGDKPAAARAFGLWNKAGGKVDKGLVRRRALEAVWYLEPDAASGQSFADMPQKVDEPKALTSSTTVVAGGTAAMATVAQIADQVAAVKYSVDGLGEWLVPVLLLVTLVAVGWVIYERYKNRDRGAI